jgi:hypothetical protein
VEAHRPKPAPQRLALGTLAKIAATGIRCLNTGPTSNCGLAQGMGLVYYHPRWWWRERKLPHCSGRKKRERMQKPALKGDG